MSKKIESKKDLSSTNPEISTIFAKKRMGAFVDSRIKSNIKSLMEKHKDFNINNLDKHGMNALHYAVQGGHQSTVKYLLNKADADASKESSRGNNPIEYSYKLILSHYIQNGVYRPTKDSNYNVSKNITLDLLEAGAKLNKADFLMLCSQYCFDEDVIDAVFTDERMKEKHTDIGKLSDETFEKLIKLHDEKVKSMQVIIDDSDEELESGQEAMEVVEEKEIYVREYVLQDTSHGRAFETLLMYCAGSDSEAKKLEDKINNMRQHKRDNEETMNNMKQNIMGPHPMNRKELEIKANAAK